MFTSTALAAYTKRTYDSKAVDNSISAAEDAILKVIKKDPSGSGEDHSWLCDADDAFNGSPDFSIAQAASVANDIAVGTKFRSDWNDWSALAQLTESIIGKTRNNDGAWMQATDTAIKKSLRAIAHANGVFLQGRGWGEICTIAGLSGATFRPAVRSDITKFVKGMPLVFSLTEHADLLRSATVIYVTAVSYTAGAELVTCNAAPPGATANGDTVFFAGARQNSATPSRLVPIGMGGWFINQQAGSADLADVTLTGTGFLNASRASNSRLYGNFVDATAGGSKLQALIQVCQDAITYGNAKRLEMFCNKDVFTEICGDLQNAVRYDGNPAAKTVGTNRLLILADGGVEAHLQTSRLTNVNQAWGFDPTDIIHYSIEQAPHISNEDGLTWCRMASSAGYETRWFQQSMFKFKNSPAGARVQFV